MRFSSLKDTTRQVTTEARSVVKRARLQQLPASAQRLRWHRGLRVVFGLLLAACAAEPEDGVSPAASSETATAATIRVASLSPLASRFALAIGAGDRIVGVDEVSARLPGLQGLPVVDLQAALRLEPDLLLVGEVPAGDTGFDPARVPVSTEFIEFAPHDLEDVIELCREVGGRLVGSARANRFEMELSRPLARIGGASFGELRPRVVAVVGFDPLELAGGHSFETDLIEIAGGSSVTHGSDEPRLAFASNRWAELSPDLIWVVSSAELGEEERSAALDALPPATRVVFFPFEPEFFWLDEPTETARRFRELIIETARARAP